MIFKEGSKLYSTEIERKHGEAVLYVNYLTASYVPSLADNPADMGRVVDLLAENPGIARVVFVQQRNYMHGSEQALLLSEIAGLYMFLTQHESILSLPKLSLYGNVGEVHQDLTYLLLLLRQDPLKCLQELQVRISGLRSQLAHGNALSVASTTNYIRLLERFTDLLSQTKLVRFAGKEGSGGSTRELYRRIFRPDILPNFTFTRLVAHLPDDAQLIDQYEVENEYECATVTILQREDDSKYLYHVSPPEYILSEEHHLLLQLSRGVLLEHRPKAEEFTDPEKTRHVFFNVARDLLRDLAQSKNITLTYRELQSLARILVRYTIGYGLLEILLLDKKLQDIVLNAPIAQNPIFVRHEQYDECVTNIIPSYEDAESWAAKLRLQSGRPLDEANPVLDTDLVFGTVHARIAAIKEPLSPSGLAYAVRRHRDQPWTLPLFVKHKMLNSFAAGLLSFFVDGSRTLLVGGTRSSGKCVDGNTLIQLSSGEIKKIKNLIGKESQKIDDGVVYDPRENYEVQTLKDFSISSKKIMSVWRRESPAKVVRMKTRTGKEIITTKEHPYPVYEGGLKWKRADELEKSTLIASPRQLHIEGREIYFDLKSKSYYVGEDGDFFFLKGKTNSSLVKFPKKLSKDFAELLGLIIGDGHIDSTKIEFHNSCQELRERYISLIKVFNVPYREFNSHTTSVVQMSCRVLSRALSELFGIPLGDKASQVTIPPQILMSKNEVLARFLRGYFDTDGYISKRGRQIELSSASKTMVEQVRLALMRFGVVSFTKEKKVHGVSYHSLFIYGSDLDLFNKHIGFFHPFKSARLADFANTYFMDNTNVDVIPEGGAILRNLRESLMLSPKDFRTSGKDYWAYEHSQYRVSRKWFKKIIEFYMKRHVSLLSFRKQVDTLRKLASLDDGTYLDSVRKVREILGLSYASLALEANLSECGVRKALKKNHVGSVELMRKMFSFAGTIQSRLEELGHLQTLEPTYGNLPTFVNSGFVSYSQLSRETGIPQTTLKYCCIGPSVSVQKANLVNHQLHKVKEKIAFSLAEAGRLLTNILSQTNPVHYTSYGIIISNLRNVLNLSNEDLAKDVSLNTVSNVFSGKYVAELNTLKMISKQIIRFYDAAVSQQTETLLLQAEELANADVFWDEIVSVEEIDKIDNFVYDLTVDETHNFVANGLVAHNTSLLGSIMLEIMPKFRTLVIEDTLELSVDTMRELGYDILRMKVRSALTSGTNEVEASEGIRTSLRLGDSALIVGEVRSTEAKALYEAMRVGALANVVAGTIHGDSPYGIFDRVVNDLGVPPTSFKATDIIIVANPVKTPDGLHSMKRVMRVTEVRKHWVSDPAKEGGFVDLLRYNVERDELEPTPELINGESEIIKSIAANVQGWAGNWDAVYDNIILRGLIKQELVDSSIRLGKPQLLEAPFVSKANTAFHRISDEVRRNHGLPLQEHVLPAWKQWMLRAAQNA